MKSTTIVIPLVFFIDNNMSIDHDIGGFEI